MAQDPSAELLKQMLSELYAHSSESSAPSKKSYVEAGDGKFLGEIDKNHHSTNSLLNKYGPYGSQYSPTSMFNKYSPYGGVYGAFSPENPYCSNPPKLFLNGTLVGRISQNKFTRNAIPAKTFFNLLQTNIDQLLAGKFNLTELEVRKENKDSFVISQDGTFLGALDLQLFKRNDSIFNQFGPYGNQYGSNNIFNSFSQYANLFSRYSCNNPTATHPPEIFVKGKLWGYLTKNPNFQNRVDPARLEEWAKSMIL